MRQPPGKKQPSPVNVDPEWLELAKPSGASTPQVDPEWLGLAEQEARGVERVPRSPKTVRDVGRAMAQGLPFLGTFAEEVEAAATRRPVAEIRREMAEARQRNPAGMLVAEIGTGLVTGGLATGAAKMAGQQALGRALQSGAVQGAVAGAGAAEGGLLERAVGGLTGMAGGRFIESALTPTSRITSRDVPRDIAGATIGMGQSTRIAALESLRNRAAGLGTKAQRAVSDALITRGAAQPGRVGRAMEAAGRLVEPTDVVKAERSLARLFPGNVPIATLESQTARATQAATETQEQLAAATGRVKASVQQTAERGKALVERAKQEAETTLQQLKAEAERAVGPLRNPQQSASALRDATRERQLANAKASYEAVEQLRPGQAFPRGVYQRIRSDKGLAADFAEVVAEKRRDLLAQRLGEPGADVMAGVPDVRMPTYKTGKMIRNPATGEVTEQTVPKLDLDMLDRMRRKVLDNMDAHLSNSTTGVTRSEGNRQLSVIKQLEEDFYKTVPPEQRAAMIAAREPVAQEFAKLRALADGQNIFRFTVGAKEEVLGAGKNDLRELLKEMAELRKNAANDPVAAQTVAHFEVGVRQAIADMAASTSDDALAVIQKLVGTQQARMRSGTVFSPDFMQQLQGYLPEQMERTAQAFAGPTARKGALLQQRAAAGAGRRTQSLQKEAQDLASTLASQRGRVESLGNLETAAKRLRASLENTPAGREAAQGFMAVDLPALGRPGQDVLKRYAEGAVTRNMQGLTLEEATKRLAQYRRNPALSALLDAELAAMEASIRPGPRVVRPALARFVGARTGAFGGGVTGIARNAYGTKSGYIEEEEQP